MARIENNKFIIGKEEYFPFSAEIHYFRVNKRYWSICFERIKKAGFRIISTCVPWNLHETSPGDFDFFGLTDPRTDLVVFLELAREFGFKVILKVGPYIGAEWENGGYPEFIFSSQEILAKNSENQPIKTSGRVKVKQGYVPSYHHPFFKSYLKRYFSALSSVIKNYIYPKGPVFLIQLDNQLSFGDNLGPFDANYSENTIEELYPAFLRDNYGDIKKLSRLYGKKYKDFTEIEPPRSLKVKNPCDLVKYFDWLKFKDKYLQDFLTELRELFLSFEVQALFFTNSFPTPDLFLPFDWQNFDKKINALTEKIPLQDLKSFYQISLANYRPYLWFSQLKTEKPFEYINILLRKTHLGLSQDFIDLKYDYNISDLWLKESSEIPKILCVPCAEFMDEETQSFLVELARRGKTIILFGLLPKMDDKMRKCEILSMALKAKTKKKLAIEEIDTYGKRYDALTFGYINASSRAQVVAKAAGKKVGVRIKLGKGEVWLFTYDISAFRNHRRLLFLEEVLKKSKAQIFAWCSDPEIDLSVHKNDKCVVLYLINPKDSSKGNSSFILKLFCRKLGIKGKRIRLIEPLENKIIRTNSKDLKNGIFLTMDNGDSRMYLVEGRAK